MPGCLAAYGIHPMYVERAREADLDALNETVLRERPLAVGEIGLDHFVEPRDEAMQEFYFDAQLRIARDHGLPVLLHVRRAIDPVLKDLRRCRVPGGIAHAFNGSRQQADEFIKLGFKLGFGGAMTFPRATRIRELAATLPLECHRAGNRCARHSAGVESFAGCRRRVRNTPDQLPRIARTLAGFARHFAQELADATRTTPPPFFPGLARIH
jgi:TatD DNase family protein